MGMIANYHLIGREIEQVTRQILGPDWHHVVGDWSGLNNQGVVLPHDDAALENRRNALIARIENRWIRRADWSMINQCVQGEEETVDSFIVRMREIFNNHSGIEVPVNQVNDSPYEQQLKDAILKGLFAPISSLLSNT